MEFDQNDTVWGLGSFEEDFQKHEGVFVENTHDKWEKKKKCAARKNDFDNTFQTKQ